MKSRLLLSLECLLLFGGIPLALAVAQTRAHTPFFPFLFGFLLITLWIGKRDPGVRFHQRKRIPLRGSLRPLLPRLACAGLALAGLTAVLWSDLLFRFPREQTRIWVLVMILYPLLSVAPQEYLFRTYFFQRYRPLFGDGRGMLIANAVAFAWAHVFFLNWVAPLLSLVAGLLLALTWRRTHDFLTVCFEHAVYGQLVFTTGVGWFFYTGSIQAVESLPLP